MNAPVLTGHRGRAWTHGCYCHQRGRSDRRLDRWHDSGLQQHFLRSPIDNDHGMLHRRCLGPSIHSSAYDDSSSECLLLAVLRGRSLGRYSNPSDGACTTSPSNNCSRIDLSAWEPCVFRLSDNSSCDRRAIPLAAS